MSLLILQAVTPLCVGQGTAVGSVNLPVARERHTQWPFIPGSSLKGALRARAERLNLPTKDVVDCFGAPPPKDGVVHPDRCGTLVFNQATLLALPLRSLQGCFMLVTCPMALARIKRELPDAPDIPVVSLDTVLVGLDMVKTFNADTRSTVGTQDPVGIAVLEELDLRVAKDTKVERWAKALACEGVPWEHLAVVHDEVFNHACAAWLPVRTRVAIGADGVVKDRQLFTQESLPPETVLWTCLDAPIKPHGCPEHQTLLPREGHCFTVGGSQTLGAGRLVWHTQETS